MMIIYASKINPKLTLIQRKVFFNSGVSMWGGTLFLANNCKNTHTHTHTQTHSSLADCCLTTRWGTRGGGGGESSHRHGYRDPGMTALIILASGVPEAVAWLDGAGGSLIIKQRRLSPVSLPVPAARTREVEMYSCNYRAFDSSSSLSLVWLLD